MSIGFFLKGLFTKILASGGQNKYKKNPSSVNKFDSVLSKEKWTWVVDPSLSIFSAFFTDLCFVWLWIRGKI